MPHDTIQELLFDTILDNLDDQLTNHLLCPVCIPVLYLRHTLENYPLNLKILALAKLYLAISPYQSALKAEKLPYGRRQSCKTFTPDVKADHNCYHSSLSEEEMQRLVFRNGPGGVSMSISSKGPSYMYLKGSPAIFTANGCSMNTCHCVLLVGWEPGYWLLKNSFGKNWGLNGFFRLPKGGSNVNKCNILNEYSSSIILSK
ncbi:hypothetical protein TYRP_004418 [Tyrophagus putrescentiae]|nr:hypothetical protein TYRP_004418 [Tyrophagus putrescentiae]